MHMYYPYRFRRTIKRDAIRILDKDDIIRFYFVDDTFIITSCLQRVEPADIVKNDDHESNNKNRAHLKNQIHFLFLFTNYKKRKRKRKIGFMTLSVDT